MQNLRADRTFFDWLRQISAAYGDAMAAWGQAVHDAAAGGAAVTLLTATDSAIERLVQMLISVGQQHEAASTPEDGHGVLDALDQLLGASVDLLREARAGMEQQGVAALAALASRIAGLRALESGVEQAAEQMRDRLGDAIGDAPAP
ncbi:MAG TPA: hypothetical protein VKV26_25015 [Dehalococcoidia bacterium]|nr:hypothetical protein [Dehalococcoidia bacterium]